MSITLTPATETAIQEAGRLIRAGGLVAFPTETVYGLGANALDATASARIFRAKGRPADNPLIVHVTGRDAAVALAAEWPDLADRLAARFWPGPLTLVVRARPAIPAVVRAGLDTVAIRCPDHPVAARLLRAAGVPIAAPSANRSGRPSPTRADDVAADLGDRVDLILDGGPTGIGVESTVVDVSRTPPVLLRPGGLAREVIEQVTGPLGLAGGEGPARSPGMKYRHYAPDRPVILLAMAPGAAVAYIRRHWPPATTGVLAPTAVVRDLPEYPQVDLGPTAISAARRLFRGLRELDRLTLDRIVAVWHDQRGLGGAVWNRLEKAAEEVRA